MAYSAGFTPHPKVSYAGAAPTGVASEAEYLEIALTEPRDPAGLRTLLDASLPAGLDVTEAVEARTSGLAERLEASEWLLRLDGVEPAVAERAVEVFLAAERVEVRRTTKNGPRSFDARAAVRSLSVERSTPDGTAVVAGHGADRPVAGACAILRLVVRHVTPAVRPDDVLSGLRSTADLAPPVPAAVTRLAQGPLDEESGTVTDPLSPDRDAAEAAATTAARPMVATAPGGSA
jgi:radical SAM-linked protein